MLVYSVPGIRINDSWYCRDEELMYHSYFLEYSYDEPEEYAWSRQRIGHMVSKDLQNWTYCGTVLAPEPGTWNDIGLATGSVVRYNNLWYMLFSGNSSEVSGIGIAVSQDLYTWKRVGEQPVIRFYDLYPFQYEGRTVYAAPLADPYVYPEPIDGVYYIFVNSWVAGLPLNQRAVQAIFTTRDFQEFHPHRFPFVGKCDRMETAQVWEHNGRFYMNTGCVSVVTDGKCDIMKPELFSHITGGSSYNGIFSADRIDGSYRPVGELQYPQVHTSGSLYISKVLQDPEGKEVMLVNNVPNGVVGPFKVVYRDDGGIFLETEVQQNIRDERSGYRSGC